MELKLSEIARLLGGTCHGDDDVVVGAVRGIHEAVEGDVTFLANSRYLGALSRTRASAVLVSRRYEVAIAQIVVADAYVAFGKLLGMFNPPVGESLCGISDKAFIESGANVAEGAIILPFACVRGGARIGRGSVIYPGVYIGRNSSVGENSLLYANVVVGDGCCIGNNVIVHGGAVIGADGFGFADPGNTNSKIPQVGSVQIDDNCEIGANVTIDRGTVGKTHLQENVKIDNLVQIAHNVVIGKNTVIAAQTGIAGSASIGDGNMIGGQTAVAGHIKIANNVMIAARSGVHKDVPTSGIVAGTPHREYRRWLRTEAIISRLPELKESFMQLQTRVGELEAAIREIKGRG